LADLGTFDWNLEILTTKLSKLDQFHSPVASIGDRNDSGVIKFNCDECFWIKLVTGPACGVGDVGVISRYDEFFDVFNGAEVLSCFGELPLVGRTSSLTLMFGADMADLFDSREMSAISGRKVKLSFLHF
jgi:hypothetical protein